MTTNAGESVRFIYTENIPCNRACTDCHARWVDPKDSLKWITPAVCPNCATKGPSTYYQSIYGKPNGYHLKRNKRNAEPT